MKRCREKRNVPTQVFRPVRCGIVASLLALLLFSIAGCTGSSEEDSQENSTEEEPVTFVGEIPDVKAFVAVTVKQVEGQREVRAYLGDGKQINEWFTGPANGNTFDLTSEGKARIEGDIAREATTGTTTLADGTSLPFEAKSATGVAGFYTVSLTDEGQVSGDSATGARLEGQLDRPAEQRGYYPVAGTITPSGRRPQNFQAYSSTAEPNAFLLVVLPDGRIKGGSTKGGGVGFVDRTDVP
jgi:hypothetical protein